MPTNRTSSENQSFLSRINPLESKVGRKVALATVLTFGATTLAACGGAPAPAETTQAQEQTPKPAPEETTEPTAEPTPTRTPDRVPQLGTIPAELAPLQEIDLNGFSDKSKDEQLTYWAALYGGEAGIREFAADTHLYSEDERDLLPEAISEANTPEEIMTVITYGERLPFALSGDDRQKAAMAVLEDDRGSSRWGTFTGALDQAPEGMTGGMVSYNGIVPMPEVLSASDPAKYEGTETVYRDITVKRAGGSEETVRAVLHSVNSNGQTFNWWTQDNDF